jgi:methionine-S-sulfoxide reductase
MFMFKKKLEMPSAAEALPGRSTPIPTAREHFVLHRPLKGPYPAGLETAMFGLGCFWGAERKFWELGDGIYTTAVGYAGGHTPNPTYEEVCSGRTGHNEVVLVVYDPKKVSYERLLKTFWESHDPTQGMRQGNDVARASMRSRRSSAKPRKLRRRSTTRNSRRAASMPSPPRSSMPLRSISPRITTSNIWRRTRWDIAAWAAPA